MSEDVTLLPRGVGSVSRTCDQTCKGIGRIMAFSAERFLEILESLHADSARPNRQPERRSEPRVGLRTQVAISVVEGQGRVTQKRVWLRDVSVHGIGVTLSESLEQGSHLLVHFPSRRRPITVLYQVMRSEPLAEHSYLIGCKLVKYVTGGPKPQTTAAPAATEAAPEPAAVAAS